MLQGLGIAFLQRGGADRKAHLFEFDVRVFPVEDVSVRGEVLPVANHSFKYFGKEQGVSVYTFRDERDLLWHSLVFSAAERESAYVIDGLMHNEVVKSDIHSTDAFGYTEAIFATSHLTGFSYAPRFKNLKRQRLYIFRSRQSVDRSAWKIKPAAYCDEQHIIQFWDDILRFIATIKLKETTASDIFRRLNSYSKQHGLYHALKAFGQILKSIFILRVIDEPVLRMSIEKVLSGIEHVHAFTRAVSVGNPREFLQAEKEDQEMAEACKRLIKNCIICWNYLYLSQKLAEIDDPAKREELLQAMAHGSAAAWGHLNLLGEYDFSEDKLQDSVGIKHPKTDRLNQVPFGSSGIAENPLRPGSWQESCGTLRTFVGLTPINGA